MRQSNHRAAWTAGWCLALLVAAPIEASARDVVERADPIERVIVYGDRAQVTRQTTVRCAGGEAKARFGPLPQALVERTLRASARGKATAVGVVARKVENAPEDDARLAPLKSELERLAEQGRALERRAAAIEAQAAEAQKLSSWMVELVRREARGGKPPVDRWGRALDGLRDASLDVANARQEIALERQQLSRATDLVQRRFDAARGVGGPTAFEVDVAVDCASEPRARVALSYVVPGATWRPEYDLRFAPRRGEVGKGKVTLGVGAAVQQATGEDWTGATLVLSSARPWLGVEPPTPAPMRIGGAKTKKGKVLVQAKERRRRLERGKKDAGASRGPAGAALDDKGQSITWTLPNAVDIRSDGRPYWVPIDRLTVSAEAKRVAIPKRSGHVFQLVEFENPAAYPLLAGRLHTWRGDSFVGTQALEHSGPGAPIEMSLGIDEAFRVERLVLDDRTRDPGFLSSTRKLPRAFAFEIRSTRKSAVTVEVRENIPVSKVAAVKVKVDRKKTTKGFEHDELTGLLTWSAKIPAGGQTKVKLGYEIALPDDWKM